MRSVQNLLILFIEYPEEENKYLPWRLMMLAATSHVMNTMFANLCQIYLKNNSFLTSLPSLEEFTSLKGN